MKIYNISDLKDFMNKLLLSDTFDYFLLEEGTIITANGFQIDGRVRKEFYTKEEQEDENLSPYVSSLLKGNVLLLVLSSPFSSCLPTWKKSWQTAVFQTTAAL